jgi:hypothetical protein
MHGGNSVHVKAWQKREDRHPVFMSPDAFASSLWKHFGPRPCASRHHVEPLVGFIRAKMKCLRFLNAIQSRKIGE